MLQPFGPKPFSQEAPAGAIIDGDYRYKLWRSWGPDPDKKVIWVMLNPSTADATTDDATIRKCLAFSKLWGFHGLEVVNLFALRATDPGVMKAHKDPVGPLNDLFLKTAAESGNPLICAWGNDGRHLNRDLNIASSVFSNRELWCLGSNTNKTPRHPLYIALKTERQLWSPP